MRSEGRRGSHARREAPAPVGLRFQAEFQATRQVQPGWIPQKEGRLCEGSRRRRVCLESRSFQVPQRPQATQRVAGFLYTAAWLPVVA